MDVEMSTGARCEWCGAVLLPEGAFCEACGAVTEAREDPPPVRCHVCDAPPDMIGGDGFCTVCGARDPGAGRRVDLTVGRAAAVSDRGYLYSENQDAFFLAARGTDAAAVVCDGVSTSASADEAASRAANAGGAVLERMLADASMDVRAGLEEAIGAAQAAVREIPPSRTPDSDPACTMVAAVVRDGRIAIGWLGDSRAYWIGPDDQRQLTTDHSWMADQVVAGTLTTEEALADPRAHSITRWVGADAPSDGHQTAQLDATESGLLVLCSDGLWNYIPDAVDIARLARQLPDAASALAIAHWLADGALAGGGHDNITVAVVDVRPHEEASS
jgi:serine/threonine protein phosphatase PrpC